MGLRAMLLTIISVFMAASLPAQEPAGTPTAVPVPPAAALPARNTHLIDEVPNYAEVLTHQWQAGVPEDVEAAERSVEHYGRMAEFGPPHPLALEECVALAVQNNTDLQIQRLGPSSAAVGVRNARAIFDPALFAEILRDRLVVPGTTALTAGGSFAAPPSTAPELFTERFNADAGLRKLLLSGGQVALQWQNHRLVTNPSIASTLLPQYTTTLGLSLNQPLLRDFGWNHALLLVEVAQNTEQQAYEQYEASIATIITQVETAYWRLVLAIEEVQVQEQGLTVANELLRQTEGRFNVGALPQAAVLEAKSEVARREANLIRSQNLRDVARDNLRAIINFREPESATLLLIDPQDKPVVIPYDIDLDRSLQTALERRPELIAARLDIHGKGLLRKNAENQLLPKLNVAGTIGVNGLSGSDAGASFALPGAPPIPVPPPHSLVGGYEHSVQMLADGRYYDYSVGASIEIPLNNATAKAGYAQANINLEQSRLSLQKLEEGVTLEIKTAVSNLQSDLKIIDATRLAREVAEENVRNQRARYNVGLVTTKDLLDFEERLTLAQAAEVQALTSYNIDLAEMRRVEGTLLSARNVLIERVSPEKPPWWARF